MAARMPASLSSFNAGFILSGANRERSDGLAQSKDAILGTTLWSSSPSTTTGQSLRSRPVYAQDDNSTE